MISLTPLLPAMVSASYYNCKINIHNRVGFKELVFDVVFKPTEDFQLPPGTPLFHINAEPGDGVINHPDGDIIGHTFFGRIFDINDNRVIIGDYANVEAGGGQQYQLNFGAGNPVNATIFGHDQVFRFHGRAVI